MERTPLKVNARRELRPLVWKIRRYAAVLFLVALAACHDNKSRSTWIAIWRSTDSTPEQRIEAAKQLIPLGADVEEVERILGKGRWNITSGTITFALPGGGNPPDQSYESYALEYTIQGGTIALCFQKDTNPPAGYRFTQAEVRKRLERLDKPSSTNADPRTHPATAH